MHISPQQFNISENGMHFNLTFHLIIYVWYGRCFIFFPPKAGGPSRLCLVTTLFYWYRSCPRVGLCFGASTVLGTQMLSKCPVEQGTQVVLGVAESGNDYMGATGGAAQDSAPETQLIPLLLHFLLPCRYFGPSSFQTLGMFFLLSSFILKSHSNI